jgi:two-component system response regulator DesR
MHTQDTLVSVTFSDGTAIGPTTTAPCDELVTVSIGEPSVSISIVVTEVNQLFLDAVVNTLNLVEEFQVVGTVCDPAMVVTEVRRTCPAVTVLGMGANGDDVLELASRLSEAVPSCRIVLIAARPTRALVDRAVAAGALSVVPTNARLPHLVDAIRGVASGCLTIDPRLLSQTSAATRSLTEREREILRLTGQGTPAKDIASRLFLSPGTVRNLTSSLIRKLGGRNRFDAARIAAERGLL